MGFKMKLVRPVKQLGQTNGKQGLTTLSEVELRDPSADDIDELGMPYAVLVGQGGGRQQGEFQYRNLKAWVERSTGIGSEVKLCAADGRRIMEWICEQVNLDPEAPQDGEKNSDGPSATSSLTSGSTLSA